MQLSFRKGCGGLGGCTGSLGSLLLSLLDSKSVATQGSRLQ